MWCGISRAARGPTFGLQRCWAWPVHLIGKVADVIVCEPAVKVPHVPTADVLSATSQALDAVDRGLIAINVQETDLAGHDQDAARDAECLRSADEGIGRILGRLTPRDLFIVTGDHGLLFSAGAASRAADRPHNVVLFALKLPLFNPDANNAPIPPQKHPSRGALIGENPDRPDVVVAANGTSDLVYLPKGDKKMAARVVRALLEQDYVSGLFVDDALGRFPGTLPLSAVNLRGSAVTPMPAIVVNFRTFATGCGQPTNCMVEIADTGLQQGQGMHGSFGRGDTLP